MTAHPPAHEPDEFRHLGEARLERELDRDRQTERWLWARAAVALLVVAVIVVVRQVWFS
jgi:hypothetical protein